MTNKPKITDNESTKELLDTVKFLDEAKSICEAIPFSEKIFPKFENVLSSFAQLKDQTSILLYLISLTNYFPLTAGLHMKA